MNAIRHTSAHEPSRIAWLGTVPKSWEIARLKGVVANVVDITRTRDRDDIYLALEHVESWTGRFTVANDAVGFDRQGKRFRAGDVLFGKLRPYLAKVICPGRGGVCAGEFLVLRSRRVGLVPKYLEQLLRSKPVVVAIDASTFGAKMPRADWQFIGNMKLPFPLFPEQRAIVRFLDHADRRIQRYIRAKERLIELLEEQKQAIIHQAVSGQIDVRTGQPYPAYKDSGVEWLGEVPEHWEVAPLKWLSIRSQNGATPPTSEPMFFENGTVPWYGPSSCGTAEEVGRAVRRLNPTAFSRGVARIVHGPAILFVVIGATAGRMALMLGEGSTNQQITAFELDSRLVRPRFILRQVRQAENWLRSTASSATIPILASNVVDRLECAVPPLAEQDSINQCLRSRIELIDQSSACAGHQINLLHECRTRLIADVVTGKLDVREAAASLPETDPLTAHDPNANPETQAAPQGDIPTLASHPQP